MAGTRFLIQSLVIVTLCFLSFASFRYGFCRHSSRRGNLTKDIPRVPGLPEGKANIEIQWWEEGMCRPIEWSIERLFSWLEATKEEEQNPEPSNEGKSGYFKSWRITLAVENVATLPEWMNALSIDFQQDRNGKPQVLFEVLQSNKANLQILPKRERERGPKDLAKLWSLRMADQLLPESQLVIYIPSRLRPMDNHNETGSYVTEWKSYQANTLEKTTFLFPFLKASGTTTPNLAALVEDWVARQVTVQESATHETTNDRPRNGKRMTREFQIDHFVVVLLPLLFPLLFPFCVSWVKEKKRFQQKGETTESTATPESLT